MFNKPSAKPDVTMSKMLHESRDAICYWVVSNSTIRKYGKLVMLFSLMVDLGTCISSVSQNIITRSLWMGNASAVRTSVNLIGQR